MFTLGLLLHRQVEEASDGTRRLDRIGTLTADTALPASPARETVFLNVGSHVCSWSEYSVSQIIVSKLELRRRPRHALKTTC